MEHHQIIFESQIEHSLNLSGVEEWLIRVMAHLNVASYDITYVFMSDDDLLAVNKKYLNHDFYTDIITFDLSDGDVAVEGDIFISLERVKENAVTHSASFIHELKRVLVHGILHLVGFDDKTETLKAEMRNKEDELLRV